MRPKLLLLLVLMAGTVVFMSFLMKETTAAKICDKKDCCKNPASCTREGAVKATNGSLNHLIVSNLK